MAGDKTRDTDPDIEKSLILGEMASMVAHKLKNPLAGMMLAATRLRKAFKNATEEEKALSIVERLCESINAFSDTVDKVVSVIEPLRIERRPVDINKVLVSALSSVSDRAKAKNIEVHRELAADLPEVMADIEIARTAFSNIMLDTLDSMDDSGVLKVVSRPSDDGQYVQILIADTRENADIAGLESLVRNPFSKGNINPSHLRLCVARRIAELHAGTIQLGVREGLGVEIVMSFPAGAGGSKRLNQ